jgi:hypothetical protein
MEFMSKPQEFRENPITPSPVNSPNSNNGGTGTNTSVSSSNSNNGIVQIPTPPLTPKPNLRSDSNPYPTTFVQADTSNFKHVVQMLTGSSETLKQTSKPTHHHHHHHQDPQQQSTTTTKNFNIPPIRTAQKKQQQGGFRLYERRNSHLKNSLMVNTLMPNFGPNSGFSPRKPPEILSPSILDFPSLTLSPVTPLNEEDPFDKSPSLGNSSEEEKAIAEKGFYLHPISPITTPRDPQPQLLPLFPVTSPRVSGSPS